MLWNEDILDIIVFFFFLIHGTVWILACLLAILSHKWGTCRKGDPSWEFKSLFWFMNPNFRNCNWVVLDSHWGCLRKLPYAWATSRTHRNFTCHSCVCFDEQWTNEMKNGLCCHCRKQGIISTDYKNIQRRMLWNESITKRLLSSNLYMA